MKKSLIGIYCVLFTLILTGCGGGGGTTSNAPEFKTLPTTMNGIEGN